MLAPISRAYWILSLAFASGVANTRNLVLWTAVSFSACSKSQTIKQARYVTIGTDFSNLTSVRPLLGASGVYGIGSQILVHFFIVKDFSKSHLRITKFITNPHGFWNIKLLTKCWSSLIVHKREVFGILKFLCRYHMMIGDMQYFYDLSTTHV